MHYTTPAPMIRQPQLQQATQQWPHNNILMYTPRQQSPQGVYETTAQVHDHQQNYSPHASTPIHTLPLPLDPRLFSMPFTNTQFQPQCHQQQSRNVVKVLMTLVTQISL